MILWYHLDGELHNILEGEESSQSGLGPGEVHVSLWCIHDPCLVPIALDGFVLCFEWLACLKVFHEVN
jgi:hypothetical protein